jgi:cytidylate kinase
MRLEELFQEGINDPHIFKAIIMAGASGSGKTYVAKKMLDGTGLRPVNSDVAFEYLMNKENLQKDMPPEEKEKRDQVRGRAKEITKKQEDLYIEGRLGLIIDGTGKSLDKIQTVNQKLRSYGYETKMLFVNTDLETAQRRNQQRGAEGGRTVDPEITKNSWTETQKNRAQYELMFKKNFYHIDNSDGQEDDTKKENFLFAWKEIRSWLEKKPSNPVAVQWQQDQRFVKQPGSQTSQLGQRKTDITSPLSGSGDWGSSSQRAYKMKRASDFTQQAVKAKKQSKA